MLITDKLTLEDHSCIKISEQIAKLLIDSAPFIEYSFENQFAKLFTELKLKTPLINEQTTSHEIHLLVTKNSFHKVRIL